MPGPRPLTPLTSGRSLWVSASVTGAGTALAGSVAAVVAVAILWLPAAGDAGSAGSALRAGLITFVAALHGGVTVDGLHAAFLPLGLLAAVVWFAVRAGRGLAAVASDLDERDPRRLAQALGLQTGCFVLAVMILGAFAHLGTSGVGIAKAFVAAAVVFAASAGTAFVRNTELRRRIAAPLPDWLAPALRVAASAVVTYLAAGALLVAASLVANHHAVTTLSARVGGGWAGLPVLLLCLLAAPNAAIAGASYLTGPGFAVGDGNLVALASQPHGQVPAFPLLGALPTGPATWPTWIFAVLTALAAGGAAARAASRTSRPWPIFARGAGVAGVLALLLAWQGGGAIGSGQLRAVGASPWQFGFAVAAGAAVAGSLVLALSALVGLLRRRGRDAAPEGRLGSLLTTLGETVDAAAADLEHRREERPSGERQKPADPARERRSAPRRDDRLAG